MSRRPRPRALSDEDLTQVLALMKGSDTVELKVTVPEAEHRATILALDMDALDAQIRQVFFFDTPDLALQAAGVAVRARRVQGKRADTVVKLRPVVPDEVPEDLRRSPTFGIEVDMMPGGFVCSGSLKGVSTNEEVRGAVRGEGTIRKLFSKEQRDLYRERAPEGLGLDDLSILGPLFVLKVRWFPAELNRKIVAELWFYPDGTRILELSTKCLPGEAFQVAVEARAFLRGHGVAPSGTQQTKTKKALTFFAKELQAASAGGG
ncbi:MAG TPA: adenylate cyclase [Actinomycetota bacterium]|jgi:hypothetical protein